MRKRSAWCVVSIAATALAPMGGACGTSSTALVSEVGGPARDGASDAAGDDGAPGDRAPVGDAQADADRSDPDAPDVLPPATCADAAVDAAACDGLAPAAGAPCSIDGLVCRVGSGCRPTCVCRCGAWACFAPPC